MALKIKGITLEIGGDTQALSKSLSDANSEISKTQKALKDVDKLLKLDPTNIDLLRQREKLLNNEIEATKKKVDALKEALTLRPRRISARTDGFIRSNEPKRIAARA